MIRFIDVHLSRAGKPLLEGANATIDFGEKIALIGRNGTGKSSLFAAICGELLLERGSIDLPKLRIARLRQDTPSGAMSALDWVLAGDEAAYQAICRVRAAQANQDAEVLADAHHLLEEVDGYAAPARAARLLDGLGFAADTHERAVDTFSGGWKMRLNLGRLLMTPADLLLLDEPTNHLDLDTVLWLEQWLKRSPATVIVISHDREFIDGVATAVLHLEHKGLKRYTGGYTAFERLAAEEADRQARAAKEQAARIEALTRFVERFKAKASKAKQAQSRMKTLERMTRISPMRAPDAPEIRFEPVGEGPSRLLDAQQLGCGYPGADGQAIPILHDVRLSLERGARLGVLGRNGQGKSTLIKTLVGELQPLSGSLECSRLLRVGYFAQTAIENLIPSDSPILHLQRLAPKETPQTLRNWMARFGVCGDQAVNPIAPLSGGEKSRVALALLAWGRPHLLVLDEPTNHLDAGAREELTEALSTFEGALLLVSHDRALLRATVDEFILVQNGRVSPFPGDLEDYRDFLAQEAQKAQKSVAAATQKAQVPGSAVRPSDQRKALAEKRRPIQKRINELEKKLEQSNEKVAKLEAEMLQPDFHKDSARVQEASLAHKALREQIDTLEEEWLERQAELESIDQPS